MNNRIIRVGIYWFPPIDFINVLHATWNGELNHYPACKLIAKHCGDCPVWGPHATLLDAVSILEKDRPAFLEKMCDVLIKYLPIELGKPIFWYKWKPNVFIRWEDEKAMERMKELRKALMDSASEFLVFQPVSWEDINDLEYSISISYKQARPEFLNGLNDLKEIMKKSPPNLIVAPNIPLSWYVDNLSKGIPIEDGKLPFGSSIHVSVATAVREDKIDINGILKDCSADEVQEFIEENIKNVPEWENVLGKSHTVSCGYVVEPAPPLTKEPIKVVVLDRIFGGTKIELRQPWIKKERLIMFYSSGINGTLDGIYEQENLGQELIKKPENRTHYLSLICTLPEKSCKILRQFSEKCVEGWDKDTYYLQKEETYHLTIVGFGKYCSNNAPVEIHQIKDEINAIINKYKGQDISFELTKPVISRSGINYMIEPSEAMDKMSHELQSLTVFNPTRLKNRNISLIRYLIPNPSFIPKIRKQLAGIAGLIFDYREKILVKKLLLVSLDKVADQVNLIKEFWL